MTRCSTGRATQKYKGGGTDLSDILETQGDIIYADSTLTAENLTISGTPGDVLKVSVSGVPEWGASTSQWVTSGSDISYITGSVGIGTTTPDANLHVNGNAFISSNLALGGVLSMGTVNVVARHTLSAITATGNLTPHTVIFDHPTTAFVTTANVEVGDALTVTGNVAVDTNTLFVDSVNNRVGIGTSTPGYTLDVTGDMNFSGTFNQNGSPFISSPWTTTGNDLSYSTGNVAVDTNTLFVDSVNNRVGIGTSTPGYTLDVVGDIHLSGTFNQNGSPFISSPWTTTGNDLSYSTGNVAVDTNTLFVDSVNNRVGIGTAGPDKGFHVNETSRFVGLVEWFENGQSISYANFGSNRDWYIRSGTAAGKVIMQDTYATSNVGIGTSTPGYKLDVTGDINFTGALTQNGTTYGGSGSSPWVISGNDISYSTGDVGIGTTSPGYKLDVTGDINFTGDIRKGGVVQTFGGSDVSYSTVENAVSTWTGRTIDANIWDSITWSPELSLFVAIAHNGTYRVATSPNGITWTGRTIDANDWRDVTWSPELSLFVAVASYGTNRVATSPDGITWTGRTIVANGWYGITWSPELSLFVAVAFSGTNQVATSPDGITWTGRTIVANVWYRITWSPELSLFAAVAAYSASGTNQVATSPDGVTWTGRIIDANAWYGITWSPELSLFVAVASSGTNRVATSPDGIAWTGRTIDANTWQGITWSPELSLFVAVADTGTNRVATSPDGITWTGRTIDANGWYGITWSPELSLFAAVASGGTNRVATSNLGIPTPLNTPMALPGQLVVDTPTGNVGIGTTSPGYDLDVAGDVNISGSLRIGGVAQTFGGGSDVSYSTVENAVSTWTSRTINASGWLSVTWSPELSLFVAVADYGTNLVATSPDGITWTNRTIVSSNWKSVTWSPELSLFVAVAGSGTYRVATSPDGIAWTTGYAIDPNNWLSVTWSPGLSLFVAVAAGTGSTLAATSPDGTIWTTRTIDPSYWTAITWSPDLSLFVVVSEYGTNQVATSPDGITWTSRTIDAYTWKSVTWSPELSLFVTVADYGTNRVATSPDGITWTSRTIDASSWNSVVWSPDLSLFVAVAGNGTNRVATSPDGITWTGRTIELSYWRSVTWSPELSMFVVVAESGTNRVATSNLGIPTPLNTPMALPGQLVVDTSTGNVGIGTTSPTGRITLQMGTGNVTGGSGMRFIQQSGTNYWDLGTSTSTDANFVFSYNGSSRGYLLLSAANSQLNFTGQHRTFIKDVPFSQVGELEGLIVSSDQNKYIKMSGGIEVGSNAITTNESLPIVSLSNVVTDKKCFGVISASEDPEERVDTYGSFVTPYEKELGDTRVYINSVGEGAIWVSNIGGTLESGDYITTSNVVGYGQKQESEFLANYTVAKITMDCDFSPVTQPIQNIKKDETGENTLDEHGQIQWEDHPTETEKAYKIRYLDANGVITDEANAVHTAAFVGCTYHCG